MEFVAVSTVRRIEYRVNGTPDRVPAGVFGAITNVGMWQEFDVTGLVQSWPCR